MKNLDPKIKILGAIVVLGLIGIIATMIWQYRASDARAQFGSPETWEVYTSGVNNLSFRYPEEFEVIAPVNPEATPFSVVQRGERGENVLIQFGTIRREDVFSSTDAFVADYERRFTGKRKTFEQREHERDGRRGVTLLQEEANGRTIGETFFFDPAVMEAPRVLGDMPPGEVREISLQLPASATETDRKLYADLYLMMLETVTFLREPDAMAPVGVPNGWVSFTDVEAGFSFYLPPDWELRETDDGLGMQMFTFATRETEENNNAATLEISALPAGQSTSLAGFMTEAFVQPFRDVAIEGTLAEEQVTIFGVGEAISLEARRVKENIPDVEEGATLLAIVGGEDTGQAGRGYVQEASLPDGGKGYDFRLEQLQAMTRSFRLIPGQ